MIKLIALSSALLAGSTVAISTTETVETTEGTVTQETVRPMKAKKGFSLEEIRESGLPYLSDRHLENLTEEQAFEITSFIDQVNATYDFSEMDDEELKETLESIKEEMHALFEELGVERPEHPESNGEHHGKRHRGPRVETPENDLEESDTDSSL